MKRRYKILLLSRKGSVILPSMIAAVVLGIMAMGVSSLQTNLRHSTRQTRYANAADGAAQMLASVVRHEGLCAQNLQFNSGAGWNSGAAFAAGTGLLNTQSGLPVRIILPHVAENETVFRRPVNDAERLIIPQPDADADSIARILGVSVKTNPHGLFLRYQANRLPGGPLPNPEVISPTQRRYFLELVMIPEMADKSAAIVPFGPRIIANLEVIFDTNLNGTGSPGIVNCGGKGSAQQLCMDMGCRMNEEGECHCGLNYSNTDCTTQFGGYGYLVGVDASGNGICANGLFDCGDNFLVGINGNTSPATPICVSYSVAGPSSAPPAPAPAPPAPPAPPEPPTGGFWICLSPAEVNNWCGSHSGEACPTLGALSPTNYCGVTKTGIFDPINCHCVSAETCAANPDRCKL